MVQRLPLKEGTWGPGEKVLLVTVYFLVPLELFFFYHENTFLF